MSAPTRLAAFAAALAVTFALGLGIGAATDSTSERPAEPSSWPPHGEHAP